MQSSLIYGKGRFRTTNLSNTAQLVFSDGTPVKGFRIKGGAAAQVVIFRAVADTPVYFQVPVAIGAYVESDLEWHAEGGLEVLTAGAAGDVEVVVHYVGNVA